MRARRSVCHPVAVVPPFGERCRAGAPRWSVLLDERPCAPNQVLFELALRAGLRRGELLGLRWADLDPDNASLNVRRTIQCHYVLAGNTPVLVHNCGGGHADVGFLMRGEQISGSRFGEHGELDIEFGLPAKEVVAMTSEGWGWLKGQPPSWETPERLRVPTRSAALNLAVQMIGSNIVGNDIVEVIAEFIAAKARLELWMAYLDPPLTLRKQFAVGRATSEAVRILYEAWLQYEEANRLAGGRVTKFDSEGSTLLIAARQATAILVSLRNAEG